MAKIIDAILRLTDNFTPVLRNAQNGLIEYSRQAQRVGKELKKTGESITKAGSTLTKSVTLPLAAIGTAAIKTTMDFDESMSKVKALSQSTDEQFKQLRDSAIEWGGKTAWSASQVSEAFQYMGLAGWKTQQMLDGIGGALNVASATGEDLKLVTDIITDGLSAFGLEAKDAAMFGDVLTATALNSNTTVQMLGDAFSYAAPLAGSFGFSVQDTSLMLGLMANSSIKASQSGTALRKIFTQLSSDIAVTQANGEEYIVSTINLDGSMRSLDEIVRDLRVAFNGMGEAQATAMNDELIDTATTLGIALENDNGVMKTSAELYAELAESVEGLTAAGKVQEAEAIAGKTAMAGLLTIINSSQEDYDKLSNAIATCHDESTGYSLSAEVAAEMLNNLSGQVKILLSGLTTFAIAIGDRCTPTLSKMADKLQVVVNKFIALSDKQKDQLIKWALIAASVGPAMMIFGKMVSIVGIVIFKFGKLGAALKGGATIMSLIFSPANTIVLVMLAVAAVALIVVKNWDKIKPVLDKVYNFMKGIWESIGFDLDGLKSSFNLAKENICKAIEAIKQWISDHSTEISSVLEFLKDTFIVIFGFVVGVLEGFLMNGLQIVQHVIDAFNGLVEFIVGIFTGDWERAWNGIIKVFENVFGGILDFATSIIDGIIGGITGAIEAVKNLGKTSSDVQVSAGVAVTNIPQFATGTDYFKGGLAQVNEKGGEIIDLPTGSRVIPHDQSLQVAKAEGMKQASGSGINITIQNMTVREDSDIDKIANALYGKFKKQALNMA